MDKKQTVLMVHNYYQIPGGEDTVVANEKRMLEKNGHKVILYTRSNSELKKLTLPKKLFLPFTAIFSIKTYKDIKRIIREECIDIVHVHNTLTLISPSVYYAALACNVPVVQTVHNFRLLCPGATFYRDGHICEDCVTKGLGCAVKHKCYRNSRLQTILCVINTGIHRLTGIYGKINYICLTEFNREKLLQLKQINPEKVFVKPNFVESAAAIVPFEQRDGQFIFAGRLDKLKGIDILLKAWAKMGPAAPKLIICGTGSMESWCAEFIAENHCNAELRGYVPNSEVIKLIAKSRALVMPTQLYESFGMTIIEAYSVGTPVIVSNLGNAGSLVKDRITGMKFEHDSVEALINTVHEFKGSDISRQGMNAYMEFKEKYANDINYSILINIYKNAE